MGRTTRSKIVERMSRLLRCNAARRLVRQQDGAAAIEFGLVAAPFLAPYDPGRQHREFPFAPPAFCELLI